MQRYNGPLLGRKVFPPANLSEQDLPPKWASGLISKVDLLISELASQRAIINELKMNRDESFNSSPNFVCPQSIYNKEAFENFIRDEFHPLLPNIAAQSNFPEAEIIRYSILLKYIEMHIFNNCLL
jgi:hypothetical protein